MRSNKDISAENESLRECNEILKEHLNHLRLKLKEKEDLLEACFQNLEAIIKIKQDANSAIIKDTLLKLQQYSLN